jgi:CheY-like chemotaxis protein
MKSIKVLIAEDSLELAEVILIYLRRMGILAENIDHVDSLPEAVRHIARTQQIDILITDWNIPSGDEGGEIIKAARERFPRAHIISMTGNPNIIPFIRETYEPDALLSKPFEMKEFVETVRHCIEVIAGKGFAA